MSTDTPSLKSRMAAGDRLVGTFIKTPAYEIVEVLAHAGLDFVCLDAEHAPFDRGRLDACLAVARALGLPALVRVPSGHPETLLGVLDSGATGVVVPHVDSPEKAEQLARTARFGPGGRGFAGSTRWAGFATRKMPEILAQSQEETVVLAQIEEPAGVDQAASIAAVPGIDGLFIGPADLSVAYGTTDQTGPEVTAAFTAVREACDATGTTFITWVPDVATAKTRIDQGVTMLFTASEHAWMLQGARAATRAIKDL